MKQYQKAYLTLMRETEKAVRLLIDAQIKCEELFLEAEGGDNESDNESDNKSGNKNYEPTPRLELLKKSLAKEPPE